MRRELFDYFVVKRSGYFDPAYYLLTYQDCRLADVDPLWHFVRYGWKERRNPCAEFDTGYYLEANPDVKQAGVNPLAHYHYLRYGRQEGRAPRKSDTRLPLAQRAAHPQGWQRGLQGIVYTLGTRAYWSMFCSGRMPIWASYSGACPIMRAG